jgi:hypothetical protein
MENEKWKMRDGKCVDITQAKATTSRRTSKGLN